jgi:hypothetical protein
VNPFARGSDGRQLASDADLDLATVGALLMNELVSDSRGMVEKPMAITFLSGGPKVVPYRLDTLDEKPSA